MNVEEQLSEKMYYNKIRKNESCKGSMHNSTGSLDEIHGMINVI